VILIAALCGSLLGCIAAAALVLRRAPAPSFPFRITSRRTRIAAAASLVAALTVVVGSFLWTPRSQTQPVTLGAGTTMLVVDLSGSVGPKQYSTIRQTLTALGAQRNRHAGLVFFSDSAAEVLPPQTPASELGEVSRFFVGDAQPVLDGVTVAAGASSTNSGTANPWIDAFEGGTAIYRGLNVARRALEQAHARHGQIVLISDLADYESPRTRTALLRIAAAKLQLRVVGLDPTEAAKQIYLDVFGPQVFVSKPKLAGSVGGDRPERASGTRTLVPAAVLGVVLLALFGLWQTPLRLRRAEP
jgi:Mg-chelatase subunit ChlD